MSKIGVDIIDDAVKRITMAMKEDRFSREELELVKKIFQASIETTDKTLARGPKPK